MISAFDDVEGRTKLRGRSALGGRGCSLEFPVEGRIDQQLLNSTWPVKTKLRQDQLLQKRLQVVDGRRKLVCAWKGCSSEVYSVRQAERDLFEKLGGVDVDIEGGFALLINDSITKALIFQTDPGFDLQRKGGKCGRFRLFFKEL